MHNSGGRSESEKPQIRYIKLGAANAWAQRAFRDSELPFGFGEVPHELALTRDVKAISDHLVARFGKARNAATNAARQVADFYSLGPDAVWVTFADGRMWWARANPEVIWLGEQGDYGSRIRHVAEGWSDRDTLGREFQMSQLSTRLTKVASMQSTMCRIDAEEYLWRKLNGQEEPLVTRALEAEAATVGVVAELISMLHWADFETMIDLLLSRSGWQRVSKLGGSMKDADILVEQPLTGEVAFVQVKSASNQAELDRYVATFNSNPAWTRMIYACHSPSGPLKTSDSNVMVWTRERLAGLVFRQGLFEWLIARTS